MYEQFYGFHEKPFTLMPDPDFLYLSDRHKEAISLLEYGLMNRAGLILITGNIGCGKTTMIRHILKNQDIDIVVGNIVNTHKSFGELLKWIMLSLNLDYKGKDKVEMYHEFLEYLEKSRNSGKRVVLIIDEAQNLSLDALEELRMLSNINVDKDQTLQLVLVGQPELRDVLRNPMLIQLAQRISVDYFLEPLTGKETVEYIQHRLAVSGGDQNLFDLESIQKIFNATNGVPRLINTICDTALVYGYAEQCKKIYVPLIEEVIKDKSNGNVVPINLSETQQIRAVDHIRL